MNLKNKNVLVTGGTGMIGQQLIKLLHEKQCNIFVASLDDSSICPAYINFLKYDLKQFENCKLVCKNMDVVFNLIGIKTSPKIMKEKPASVFLSYLQFNTNMIEAARQENIKWFLYTSSIGVYKPSSLMVESDMWNNFPSKNDWYGGWGKRIGELQIESYTQQYGINNFSIVRPANVYGPHDDFSEFGMVIPTLIKKMVNKEPIITLWGNGTEIRDFIYSKDVASGMIFCVENEITDPVNLGSGIGISIKELTNLLIGCFDNYSPTLKWDTSITSGDNIRVLSMDKIKSYGFIPTTKLKIGLLETINWFKNNEKTTKTTRYNSLI